VTKYYRSEPDNTGNSNPNRLYFDPDRELAHITLLKGNSGFYVNLKQAEAVEFALDILGKYYDVDQDDNEITLELKSTVKVGDYYRVVSEQGMSSAFQYNPIVKVTEVIRRNYVKVETSDGEWSEWDVTSPNIVGPISVSEKTVWIED
jgi:hypothetical protein